MHAVAQIKKIVMYRENLLILLKICQKLKTVFINEIQLVRFKIQNVFKLIAQ